MTKSVLFFMLTVLSLGMYAQDITVEGSIFNAQTKEAVSNVEVRLKGAINIEAKSDEQGHFKMIVPEKSSKKLVFTADGFDKQEIDAIESMEVFMVPATRVNQYGKSISQRTPIDVENRDGILVFESADKKFKYWFDSRLYFDGAYFFDENAYNPIGNGVNVRRARFAIKANLWQNWYGELDLDFAGAVMELKDAYLKYTTDNQKFNFKIGNFKEGFSMESTTTSRYLMFTERSLVNELAPSRHMGVNGTYSDQLFTAIAGVHFQKVGEAEEVAFTEAKNKDDGIDEGISFTGRLAIHPKIGENLLVHVGGGASYRTPKTSWETERAFRLSTRSLTTINRKKYLDTDEFSAIDNQFLTGAELAFAYKNIMFQGEYMMTQFNRFEGYENAKFDGFYAQAGYLIFGGNYNYNNGEAEFTQVTRGKEWGDLELAIRYDYLNLNDFEAQIYGGSAQAYTIGLNYYVNDNVKFMLNYSILDHDRYANGKGKLNVGHDVDGNLTSDYKTIIEEAGTAGDDFGFIQARIEIDF
ncbi:MAG: porin [Bacteroidales bacterium]|nr:porin [Bacteroidales bacterium]